MKTILSAEPWATKAAGRAGLKGASARDELDDQHDHRDHDQKVNESAADVHRETGQPQNDENDDDEPK
jgi:hypothetical protein